MSVGRVSFIGEVEVANFPHTETIVVVEGKLSLIAADAARWCCAVAKVPSSRAARRVRIQAASRAQFVFCAAAAELANQPGITRLRADADFKPSNSLPAEMLLGPAPQCRSDNVFKDDVDGGTSPAPGIRRLTTGSFARTASTSSCICWPAACGSPAPDGSVLSAVHRRCAVRAAGRTDRLGKQRSRGEVLRRAKACHA